MRNLILSLTLLTIVASCNSGREERKVETIKSDSGLVEVSGCEALLAKANQFDKQLLSATLINNELGQNSINAFLAVVNSCKTDSISPILLLKAGQVAQSIKKYADAGELFKRCSNEYPSFKNRGAALFLLATLYDDATMLDNEEEAKKIYQQIIKEYPKTDWSRDAQSSINNLGKTDEQLIQEFLKKSH